MPGHIDNNHPFAWMHDEERATPESIPGYVAYLKEKLLAREAYILFLQDQIIVQRKSRINLRRVATVAVFMLSYLIYRTATHG